MYILALACLLVCVCCWLVLTSVRRFPRLEQPCDMHPKTVNHDFYFQQTSPLLFFQEVASRPRSALSAQSEIAQEITQLEQREKDLFSF